MEPLLVFLYLPKMNHSASFVACVKYGEGQRFIEGLVENPEGRKETGGPRRKLEDNSKMYFKEKF
jgi:hypothetical protein